MRAAPTLAALMGWPGREAPEKHGPGRTAEESTDIIIRGIEDLKARCAARIAELQLEVLELKAAASDPAARHP